MISYKNTKKQKDVGLSYAICYFTSIGQTVPIPLTDSQDYNLIVDFNNILKKIQIKSCSYKRKYFEVNLSIEGGNRSGIGKIKRSNNSNCDYLFIVVNQSNKYLIPTNDLKARCSLVLGPKYQKYLVK